MPRVLPVCPDTHATLTAATAGLVRADGRIYPYLPGGERLPRGVPVFLDPAAAGEVASASLKMYDTTTATAIYRNYLDWLFATFRTDEAGFRAEMAARLRLGRGDAVLVTGCGLGDDIPAILDRVGPNGEVHAQDLSSAMVLAAATGVAELYPDLAPHVVFSVGDAGQLPYADNVFDAAYHFGGINLFDEIGQGIAEMARVVRPGGRVVLSDEGIGPWLHATDYGRMVITNNRLWGLSAPIEKLPPEVADISLSWILGNCFWVIEFTVADGLPAIDPHVPHKGTRGGSMWTRYHGQIEAVTPETRARVLRAAAAAGMSVHDWLELALAAGSGSNESGGVA